MTATDGEQRAGAGDVPPTISPTIGSRVVPKSAAEIYARLEKRGLEIEAHVAKYPGYYPEAIQHAADIRHVLGGRGGHCGPERT